MKRTALAVITLILGCVLCACHFHKEYVQEEGEQEKAMPMVATAEEIPPGEMSGGRVSLFFPKNSQGRWTADARMLKEALEEKEYEVFSHFAKDNPEQEEQILHALQTEEPEGLLVVPIDAKGLAQTLAKVKEQGTIVLAYEKLPMNTQWVDAYVTCDYYETGKLLGNYLKEELNLDSLQQTDQKKTLEIFPGSRKDVNQQVAYLGLTEVLQPYLEEGVLVVRSGNMSFEEAALDEDMEKAARRRCKSLLQKEYEKKPLEIVCTFSDEAASGVQRALKDDGYQVSASNEKETPKKLWPFFVNIGYGRENAGRIRTGRQQAFYKRDGESLAKEGARVLDLYICGKNNEEDAVLLYDNGEKIVPAYVCPMLFSEKTTDKEK